MSFIEKIESIKPKDDFFNHTYVSLRNRYVYTAVGKAANSTVKHHIYKLEYEGTRFKIKSVHDRQSSPLLSPFQLPDDILEEVFTTPKYCRFSMVRNPYTRLLSCYLDRILPALSAPYRQLLNAMGKPHGTPISFAEFIETVCKQKPFVQNNHWRLQTHEICAATKNYDYIGKQENFAADMTTVWKHIAPDLAVPDFKGENKSPSITSARKFLQTYYSPELINLVSEAYREDFETFGYDFDIDAI
jgi:hypothetical protein